MTILSVALALTVLCALPARAWLDDTEKQKFLARIYQSTLRGPRMPGSLEQLSFLDSVADSMRVAGASTSTLNYTMHRWDARWWYLEAHLTNGTTLWVPTTGYYPYSGNTGLSGITGPAWDAGTYEVDPSTGKPDFSTINFDGATNGSIAFFYSPPQTTNNTSPLNGLAGTGRGISPDEIPELSNLTNAHTTSKTLDFDALEKAGFVACVGAYTGLSDGNVALQWRPGADIPPNGTLNTPTLFTGEPTGRMLQGLIASGQVENLTVTLDAPSFNAPSSTLVANLPGTGGENGGFAILTMIEYFAKHPLSLNLQVVIETGHMSSGLLNETAWIEQRPDILETARAALMIEHLGAQQYKDVWQDGVPVYQYTGKTEAIFSYANNSARSDFIRAAYLESYSDTPDYMRMPLITPNVVDGKVVGGWPGLGGASRIGLSDIPTIGLEVQPDYLWAFMIDGGWSRFNGDQATYQVETLIKTAYAVDQAWHNGTLYGDQ